MHHALTIDVEDYFQVAAFFGVIDRDDWGKWPSRVDTNTRRILDLLDEHDARATFFVLGWVAERQPDLVREIARRGHEVGCHGFSHRFIYEQSEAEFRAETQRAKALLEDITGDPVRGYRAASYSITEASCWALETIRASGFEYDSSVFPIRHDNYGLARAPGVPHWAATAGGRILEFPLTTARLFGMNLPVAGGGYFRAYPYALTRTMIRRHERMRRDPFIFYLHPWEIDPQQPRIAGAPLRSRMRHYINLASCEGRLMRLLGDFRFTPLGRFATEFSRDDDLATYRYTD